MFWFNVQYFMSHHIITVQMYSSSRDTTIHVSTLLNIEKENAKKWKMATCLIHIQFWCQKCQQEKIVPNVLKICLEQYNKIELPLKYQKYIENNFPSRVIQWPSRFEWLFFDFMTPIFIFSLGRKTKTLLNICWIFCVDCGYHYSVPADIGSPSCWTCCRKKSSKLIRKKSNQEKKDF